MTPAPPSTHQGSDVVTLQDRYTLEDGRVHLTGIQALVRLVLAQARRDREAGLRIGSFVSGYQGSPLGGLDLALGQVRNMLEEHGAVHVPALNEELAATALRGTQMLDRYAHSRFDGVTGFWYGKGPGMDRSGDALRHGNFAGTSEQGAVVVLSGEDHEAKSSSMPYEQQYAFMHHGIPVVYPATVAEFLELGMHAVAMSRFAGCWVGMKLVGQLCDGGQTVRVHPDRPGIVVPELEIDGRPYRKRQDHMLFPGQSIETERWVFDERLAAATAYARANGLDTLTVHGDRDRMAVVTAGKSHADTMQALRQLGLDDDALRALGVRVLKLGVVYPLDTDFLRETLTDVTEVLVVEEKRPLLEHGIKEALYEVPAGPRVIGKRDVDGSPVFPDYGSLDADVIAATLAPRLSRLGRLPDRAAERLAAVETVRQRDYVTTLRRAPNYCSGCPHNVSTVHPEDHVAWGSPGCHIFAAVMDQPHRQVDATFQLGGEGAGWVGLSPFTDLDHVVQNQGDGSLFHSSYLNIRFAVASGVSLTFKILFNGSAANTGAQEPVGGSDVPRLCQALALDGVAKIAVIARSPSDYRRADLPTIARVHRAEQVDAVLADLRQTPGVTIFLYDGMCANEERRQRKRGLLPRSDTFVVINEDVCENCGDCGAKTNCMSLQKVDTEFGPKTAVHQSSCNQAQECLVGDCPSFVTVTNTEPPRRPRAPHLGADAVPDPELPRLDGPYQVYVPGVGGTGVLTVNAMLAWAALLDGRDCVTYDQTGAAQKWGAVLSNIAICPRGHELPANTVARARADLLLALDLAAAADPANLDRCSPERTAAVVNSSLLPTGEMIRNARLDPAIDTMTAAIERFTDSGRSVTVAAQELAEKLFGDYMATNVVAVGAAHQAGLLPLSAESIESALRLNGTAVDQNVQAFRYGRLAVHDPAAVAAMTTPQRRNADEEVAAQRAGLRSSDAAAYDELVSGLADLGEEARRLLAVRAAELIRFQDAGYARDYVGFVREVADAERQRRGSGAVTTAVIRNLYRLMAYKDEYEVARLHLTAAARQRHESLFGPRPSITYHLQPPVLRALGMRRKLRLGRWFELVFHVLHASRRLRGTRFDPFGHAHVRREERRLVGWYRDLVRAGLEELRPMTEETVRRLAELPDLIRGYEDVKLAGVAAATERATELVAELDHPTRLPLLRS